MRNFTLIKNRPWFNKRMEEFLTSESTQKLRKEITERKFRLIESEESYRTINSWEEKGLLLDNSNRGAKWHRFSLVDLFWLKIIKELRDFGITSKTIQNVRSQLLTSEGNIEQSTIYFEFFVYLALAGQETFLILTKSGLVDLVKELEFFNDADIKQNSISYLVINLHSIHLEFLRSPKNIRQRVYIPLSDKELEVFSKLKTDHSLSEVNMTVTNGKIKRFETVEKQQNPKSVMSQLAEELRDKSYKKLIITQKEDGSIAAFEKRKKK